MSNKTSSAAKHDECVNAATQPLLSHLMAFRKLVVACLIAVVVGFVVVGFVVVGLVVVTFVVDSVVVSVVVSVVS